MDAKATTMDARARLAAMFMDRAFVPVPVDGTNIPIPDVAAKSVARVTKGVLAGRWRKLDAFLEMQGVSRDAQKRGWNSIAASVYGQFDNMLLDPYGRFTGRAMTIVLPNGRSKFRTQPITGDRLNAVAPPMHGDYAHITTNMLDIMEAVVAEARVNVDPGLFQYIKLLLTKGNVDSDDRHSILMYVPPLPCEEPARTQVREIHATMRGLAEAALARNLAAILSA